MPELAVSVVRDASCFELPEWRALIEADPDRHVFQTPEWNRLWWQAFQAGKDLCVLVMTRDDLVRAIVPLYRKTEDGERVLRFVGGIDLTDYLGPICSHEDREAVARAVVDWLVETDIAWDVLDAHNMPVPLGFAEHLVDHADRRGFAFRLEQEETSALLPLGGDWDGYVAALGGKDRHELRRKMRRFRRAHPDARLRSATSRSWKKDLDAFVALHRRAQGGKAMFMTAEMVGFFTRVARAFVELGWLRLDLLEVGDRVLASAFSFDFGGRFYLYNSAYEPEERRLSPGFVLVAELVRRGIESGLETFDFLRGAERYKYGLGAQPVPLNNVRVLNQQTTEHPVVA